MSLTHVIIAGLLGSFWAGAAALVMRIGLLKPSPWPIAAVGAFVFATCLLMFSLCIVSHDCKN